MDFVCWMCHDNQQYSALQGKYSRILRALNAKHYGFCKILSVMAIKYVWAFPPMCFMFAHPPLTTQSFIAYVQFQPTPSTYI